MSKSDCEPFFEFVNQMIEEREKVLGREATIEELALVEEEAFYAWLAPEHFDDLIRYLHDDFEDCGGHEQMEKLGLKLRLKGDTARLHRLFRGLIPGRIAGFWRHWSNAKKESIESIVEAAKYKADALHAMYEYFNNLYQLGDRAVAAKIQEDILLLHNNKKKLPPKVDVREMSPELFWELIAIARNGANNASEFSTNLSQVLTAFKPKSIKQFGQHLQDALAKLWSWDLWALAFMVRGGCSDDGFDYFRAWIVAQGEKAYVAALGGPQELKAYVAALGGPQELADMTAFVWDLQCEELLRAVEHAYYARTSKEMPALKIPETTQQGTRWSESELPTLYPKLWSRFCKHAG